MSDILDTISSGNQAKIPVDSCVILGDALQKQDDTKLIDSIRATHGIIQPIIAQRLENEKYGVSPGLGRRRVLAYRILQEEDPYYKKIKAYVVDGLLTPEQCGIISFLEGMQRKPMEKSDYVDVIEYIYEKYEHSLKDTAKALGLTVAEVKKYLTSARLSDKVKEVMKGEDGFSIDIAMKALQALGDDEDSVYDEMLIETAKELKKAKPATRNKAVKIMKEKVIPVKQAIAEAMSTTTISIEFTGETGTRLEEIAKQKGCDSVEELVIDLLEKEEFKEKED